VARAQARGSAVVFDRGSTVIASGGAAGRKMMQMTGAATTTAPITTTGAGAAPPMSSAVMMQAQAPGPAGCRTFAQARCCRLHVPASHAHA
jgi:hypothetical protein